MAAILSMGDELKEQMIGHITALTSYSFICTLQYLIVDIIQTYLKTLNLKSVRQIYFVSYVCKILFSQSSLKG